jgi:tetratricopeptide (TPR) repeat protein
LINYGNLLGQIKYIDEAIEIYEKVLSIDPDNSMALSNIANSMLTKRDLDKAWEYAERTCKVNPSAAGSFLYTMCFHCDWEKYDEILEVLEKDKNCELSGPFAPIIFSNNADNHLKYNKNWAKKVKPTGILGPIGKIFKS